MYFDGAETEPRRTEKGIKEGKNGAGKGARTLDLHVGNVAL